MSKLANILGVTDESDLHNIVDNKVRELNIIIIILLN